MHAEYSANMLLSLLPPLLLLLQSYGAVIDIEGYPDVVGLVTPDHGGTAELQGNNMLDNMLCNIMSHM
jgi:hypothetical protein